MNLVQLESFCMVADCGSITNAASKLHVTQPALSKMIIRLEEDVGFPLFDRRTKNMVLNANGKIVYENAKKIFAILEDMGAQLNDLNRTVSGTIYLGSTIPKREPGLLASVVRKFVIANPMVHMRILPVNVANARENLENGTINMAVTAQEIIAPGIEWHKFFSERVGITLAEHHPLAKKEKIFVSDLKNESFICGIEDEDIHDFTYSFCSRAGFEPNIYFQGDFPSVIGEVLSLGRGISFIPESSYQFRLSNSNIPDEAIRKTVFRYVEDDYCRSECGIAMLSSKYHTLAEKEFCRLLFEEFHVLEDHLKLFH